MSLLGIFGQAEKTTSALLEIVQGFAPAETVDAIRQPVEQLSSSSTAGFALVIGILTALWSASGYVGAFGRAMNRVYEVDEGRPFIKLRGTMLGVTIATLLIVVVLALMLVLSGPVAASVGNALGLGGAFVAVWNIAKWPVILLLVVLAIAILYYATPNVEQPKFRWMSLGSVIALMIFLLASAAFAFYAANFSSYNKTYGAIGGVIISLLWLWILNMSLLFGAEFDAEMERGRQLQAGHRGRGDHPAAAPGHQTERQAAGPRGRGHPARTRTARAARQPAGPKPLAIPGPQRCTGAARIAGRRGGVRRAGRNHDVTREA